VGLRWLLVVFLAACGPTDRAGDLDAALPWPDAGPGDPIAIAVVGGNFNDEYIFGLSLVSSGDAIISGYFADQTDLGTGPLVAAGGEPTIDNQDGFIAQVGKDGGTRWAHRVGTPCGFDIARRVATQGKEVYALVSMVESDGTRCPLTFDDTLIPMGPSEFERHASVVLAISPEGALRWATPVLAEIATLVADLERIYVMGTALDAFELCGQILEAENGLMFAAALRASDGSCEWVRVLAAPPRAESPSLASLVLGPPGLGLGFTFSGTVTFADDGGTLTSHGGTDALVLVLDPADGRIERAHVLGGPGDDRLVDLDLAADGELRVTGTFADGVVLGNDVLSGDDAFLARLGSDTSGAALGVVVEREVEEATLLDGGDTAVLARGLTDQIGVEISRYRATGERVWQLELKADTPLARIAPSYVESSGGDLVIAGRLHELARVPGLTFRPVRGNIDLFVMWLEE
jgi:hypothetical protein